MRQASGTARRFLATETAGGIVLLAATTLALLWANSPWQGRYERFQEIQPVVNDGLMALFFFVVGLEIKREVVRGELADRREAILPVVAALGGMAVPACLYAAITAGTAAGHGWGIPMATDIAFALGVLALLHRRVPSSLKLLLLTLAVVDDIGAIVIIAVFYGGRLDLLALGSAAVLLGAIAALRRLGVHWPPIFLALGLATWYATYRSGIHPTIAGVAVAVLIPSRDSLEERLHPWTSFLVLPCFALANAGIAVRADLLDGGTAKRAAAAIVVALVAGKTLGILGGIWLCVRVRLAALPPGVSWRQVAGIAALGGIGFTVSLFIASLAFDQPGLADTTKLAVLVGSVVAAIVGTVLLRDNHP